MSKTKAVFACEACGTPYPRWQGKCTACGTWDSIVEQQLPATTPGLSAKAVAQGKGAEVVSLDAPIQHHARMDTGITEFNRVLGGGLVVGSAVLIGGDPGIGKSTLLLQAAASLAAGFDILYISGEESPDQIQLRARRLGIIGSKVKLAAISSLENILATIRQHKPDVVIIDSIQTVYAESAESAPGTVSQIRLSAHELTRAAKQTGTVIIFVGHVTKDGNIAGPRVLEHMVDTVLYFEGERGQSFRLLRAFKNRFGSTGEIGVFDMREQGLCEVVNPSELFLSERPENASGSAVLAAINGTRPVLLEVQALVNATPMAQPRRTALGLDQNRLAMIGAVLDKHAGFTFASHDIYLNITGGLKINEPAADLAVASALISSLMSKAVSPHTLTFGEIGLSGEVRNVTHTEQRLKEACKLGYTKVIGPRLGKGVVPKGLKYIAVASVNDLGSTVFDA